MIQNGAARCGHHGLRIVLCIASNKRKCRSHRTQSTGLVFQFQTTPATIHSEFIKGQTASLVRFGRCGWRTLTAVSLPGGPPPCCATRLRRAGHVTVCSWNTTGTMGWAQMLWSPYALGKGTEPRFGHGCPRHRVLLEHERNHGLGADARVINAPNPKITNPAFVHWHPKWLPGAHCG